jgi:hypothetical protein
VCSEDSKEKRFTGRTREELYISRREENKHETKKKIKRLRKKRQLKVTHTHTHREREREVCWREVGGGREGED